MQSPPSSADSSTCRPRGRLLRQETAEYEHLLRDKFNMALRINYLEDQLRLLEDGEGYTDRDILVELRTLRYALKTREHELREHALKLVNELEAQEAKTAAGVKYQTHEQREVAVSDSAGHYQEMCSTLQEELDGMVLEKQKAIDAANDSQRQLIKLLADYEQQGKARHDLKISHDKALNTIYQLESELLKQYHAKSEEHSKTRGPAELVSEGHRRNLAMENNKPGRAVNHQQDTVVTTSNVHQGDSGHTEDTKLTMKSYRDLHLKLQEDTRCLTQAKQDQLEKDERLDNEMLSQPLRETKQEVDTVRSDLDVEQHEVAVRQFDREVAQTKYEKQILETHGLDDYRWDKEREILKLEENAMHTTIMIDEAPMEKKHCRSCNGNQALEGKQKSSQKGSLQHLQGRNRFVLKDLQECCTQCKVIFRENTDLLKAITIYKKAIADRDADIAMYKAKITKYLHQFKHRSSVEQVSDELARQLKETKSMLIAMSKHLESCIVNDADSGANENCSALPVSACRLLKAIHSDRLTMLSKQLEDVENQMRQ